MALAIVGLIGCGGGSSSDTTAVETTNTGTFVDAPVKGITYLAKPSGISGVTGDNGEFKYKTGDVLEFKIGETTLGTSKAKSIITPYDVAEDNTTLATNIAYLLQNLDEDGNISNGIQLKAINAEVNLSDENNITNTITNIIGEVKIDKDKAKENMIEYLKQEAIMTPDTGFIKEALVGKTYIVVHKYWGDEELEKYGWVDDVNITFTNDKVIFNFETTYLSEDDATTQKYDLNITDDGKWYVPDEGEISENELIDVLDDGILVIKNSTDPEGAYVYLIPSNNADKAKELATLLNVKDTKSFDGLIGKKIYSIEQEGVEYNVEGYLILNDNNEAIWHDIEENKDYKATYTKNSDGTVLQIDIDDEKYIEKIVDVDLKTKSIIIEETDLEDNIKTNFYTTLNLDDAEYIAEKLNMQTPLYGKGKIIDPKTLIGKKLYRLEKSSSNKYGVTGIELKDDELIRYWYSNSNLNTFKNVDLDNISTDDCDYDYNVSYIGNYIKIDGHDCDGDDEYDYNEIREYDLKGLTLSTSFLNQAMDGEFDFGNTKNVTFNSGKAYCTILWGDCWFDKEATEEILNSLEE